MVTQIKVLRSRKPGKQSAEHENSENFLRHGIKFVEVWIGANKVPFLFTFLDLGPWTSIEVPPDGKASNLDA